MKAGKMEGQTLGEQTMRPEAESQPGKGHQAATGLARGPAWRPAGLGHRVRQRAKHCETEAPHPHGHLTSEGAQLEPSSEEDSAPRTLRKAPSSMFQVTEKVISLTLPMSPVVQDNGHQLSCASDPQVEQGSCSGPLYSILCMSIKVRAPGRSREGAEVRESLPFQTVSTWCRCRDGGRHSPAQRRTADPAQGRHVSLTHSTNVCRSTCCNQAMYETRGDTAGTQVGKIPTLWASVLVSGGQIVDE